MDTLYQQTLDKLRELIEKNGSIRGIAEMLDLNPSTVSRWFQPAGNSPNFLLLCKIMEHFSVQIIFPGDRPGGESMDIMQQLKEVKESLRLAEKERDAARAQAEAYLHVIRIMSASTAPTAPTPPSTGAEENRVA